MSEVERLTDEVKGKADDKAGLAREEIENAMKRSAAETTLSEFDIPDGLKENMTLFLRLTRKVIGEYDEELCDTFDALLADAIMANLDEDDQTDEEVAAFSEAVKIIDDLPVERATLLMRGFATYFHLANICEENYRVTSLRQREEVVPTNADSDPINDITVAYRQLVDECGRGKAIALLNRLEFHPVFTAHPTEARRKAVEGKIRRISALLEQRPLLAGVSLAENERRMLQEIDALFRTSPIAHKKPTPVEEADTILDIFDNTLFEMVPEVYRRFDDWELGEKAGTVPPVCPAFFHPGSWIGSDRDGNPNVTAKVSRKVAEKFRTHMLETLAEATHAVGRNITLDTESTPASDQLLNLWSHQVEMSEVISAHAMEISAQETHRAVMLVISERLKATVNRTADLMYNSAEDYIEDLKVVQRSLAAAGAVRTAYGPVQRLIWQAQTFGFHMVEMEFRQHSVVHSRALADIREHGRWGERGELQPMTREVLDTFRAIGSIQRKNGVKAARRYIISFTKSAQNVADVYELAHLAFAHEADVPVLDVIPLFEQVEDLENSVDTLNEVIKLPQVQRRLAETGRRLEVMLGYSDSSKDAGPTSATLVLHAAQERIAKWAEENNIDLVLMHGRGGAVGRGGGPANRAVLSQPKGSVNCRFKLTEQGEVIFARYGDPTLARRHIESVAGATLLQSAPSIEYVNTETIDKFSDISTALDKYSRERYLDLLNTDGFAEWFSFVTPLTEIGLMPIGSRPAKRGLGAKSLDDLRTIPWIFSWSQARTNLAAWYGLGTACEKFGDLDRLQEAYKEWPLFTTFVDNIEMSISKTDDRIAEMFLSLGDREDLNKKVLDEMRLTRKWVLAITGNNWPLEHRRVLGPVIHMRLPFVNVLSIAQARALQAVRTRGDKLTPEERERFIYLILCTVSGVAAGLQNTG
ncbi:Phosphoenolpyruvate carboxylase, type 1 [Olsenella sp. KH1P3]|uniref:Phosphoenolpyruvate carboxylase n=2 Tax=Coriobacteriales TaxID=84999 RepID=A0A1H9N2W9_9ACTN|nr:Phosphoenolpyruvate carboxylase, type 1 [Parafannyhessea umbonata]SER30228.1 Phosphoenolpyruvate carboxylase, type 1 [Parafannyhessea umbonata]SJZ39250.1 Phosphoenolpyruvate carboxylase, type 1 [Olsenella sp. KH1P3]